MDFGTFQLKGFSLGGIETAVVVPQLSLAVDVGRGRRDVLRCDHLALTHTHMDHVGGLPYLLALRQLMSMRPPKIYAPVQMVDRLRELIEAWDRVQRYASKFELIGAEPGQRYPLGKDTWLEPFRTYHTVPSCGYSVIRSVAKLRPEYVGTPGAELGALRRSGVEITRTFDTRILSVTGDTLPEVLDREPHILTSEVLVLECTFLDDRKPYEAVRAGGHVHLRDLVERADLFANKTLVLSHFSQIYKPAELPELLADFAARVVPEVLAFPMAPEDGTLV